MEYRFTDEDLWAYLAAKQDGEVVGYCGSSSVCLIAQAVKAKYPDLVRGVDVYTDGHGGAIVVWGVVTLPLSLLLQEVACVFDWNTGKRMNPPEPVAKAEFMQAWQAWQAFLTENG
jgi:hypothetical protein